MDCLHTAVTRKKHNDHVASRRWLVVGYLLSQKSEHGCEAWPNSCTYEYAYMCGFTEYTYRLARVYVYVHV